MSLFPAIATVSLGRATAGHALPDKIKSAAAHSFQGVEIFYECLEQYALSLNGSVSEHSLTRAAKETKALCDDLGVSVVCLMPLMFFEGLTDPRDRTKSFQRLKLWFKLAHALGTDLIQVPTNFQQEGTTGDKDRISTDLREAAVLGLQEVPIIRLAYEGVSWGTHIDTWEDTWEIVKRIDLPNLGLCLDTFHIAGRVWGDPASATGKRSTGDIDLTASIRKMVAELDVSKVFYIQIGDAQRLSSPLVPGHQFYDAQQPKRMSWSRNARLFPFEVKNGGYLPISQVLFTLLHQLGYSGWASMETFSSELHEQDAGLPERYALRGEIAWGKTLRLLASWKTGSTEAVPRM
jgi:4-hydroxyphenylpyruvate dioxygenase